MFGFGGGRKPAPDRSRAVGVDLTASRARAVSHGDGTSRVLLLDGPADELRLLAHLDRRPPEVGRAAAAVARKLPHAVAAGYLARLAQPAASYPAGRSAVTADDLVRLAVDRLAAAVAAEADTAGLAVPGYLTPPQVGRLAELAAKAKLPLAGTAAGPLAVAAHRAFAVRGEPDDADVPVGAHDSARMPRPDADWVVPIRPPAAAPGAVVVVDADDHALTATAVQVDADAARVVGSAGWPKLAAPAWVDRVLDAACDRCVRVCRRDPRDSADAEQGLWDQLPAALAAAARGQPVTLGVRGAHWYQDLPHRPADFDGYCGPLAKAAADGLRELLWSLPLAVPPRGVWLTAAAGRLPGLAAAVHRSSPERTAVETLPPHAVAEAAAALAGRWRAGTLPPGHYDAALPVDRPAPAPTPDRPADDVPYARRASARPGG